MATLSRSDYFEAALALLAERGPESITIGNLCERLGITKGSFYHHFKSVREFVRELLTYWEAVSGRLLMQDALDVAEPMERVEWLARRAISLNHDAEREIRILARTDEFAAQVIRELDVDRTAGVQRTLQDAGLGRAESRRLANLAIVILVGLQQTMRPVDRRRVREAVEDLAGWVTVRIEAAAQEREPTPTRSG